MALLRKDCLMCGTDEKELYVALMRKNSMWH